MATDFKAALDSEDLSPFDSAASPLTAMGIDPDEARANPDLLDRIQKGTYDPVGVNGPKPPMRGQDDTPAAPASAPQSAPAAPQADPSKQAESYATEGLGLLHQNLQDATKAAGDVPTQTPDEINSLTERRSRLATPAARFDSRTGKELTSTQEFDPTTGESYDINPKASKATKIWRGVRGGLVGLGTQGFTGAVKGAFNPEEIPGGTAYNAPSKAYQQAEDRRVQALGQTDDELKNARDTWKQAVDASKAKASEYRANATLGKDEVTGATGVINAENKPDKEDKAQIQQKEFDQRGAQADRLGLKGVNRTLFMANGKLPDPKQPTEGEVALTQATKAFIAENGHPPQTVEEMNKVAAASKGGLDKGNKGNQAQLRIIEQTKANAVEKANQAFANADIEPGKAVGQYQRQLQEAQNAYEADLAAEGLPSTHQSVTVDSKGQATWTPQQAAPTQPTPATTPVAAKPAAAPPAVPPAKPQPAPDGARIKLKDGTIQVKKNGKWVNE